MVNISSPEYREFIGLEAEASSVAVWHVDVVTGILQTERYAHALMAQYSKVEPIAPAFIDRRVQLRMLRKQLLEQDPPPSLLSVLDASLDADTSRELIIQTAETEWRRS